MSQLEQFWWNWGIQALVAAGTIGAVLAALFGDRLRAAWFKPLLQLRILDPRGTAILAALAAPSGDVRHEQSRYYYLSVENGVSWPHATQVQVYLTRIEEFGPDQSPQIAWTGDVPMRWCHQEIYPMARTIGSPAICDFFSIVKDKWLELHPLVLPNNLIARRREKTDMIVSLQARSNETQSEVVRVRISWDGQWAEGQSEMSRHATVRVVED